VVIDLKAAPVPQDIDTQRGFYINEFIEDAREPVLIIGGPNRFDALICYYQSIKKYSFTQGDLNWEWGYKTKDISNIYKTAFCFDVIEHLFNPGMFLDELKKPITPDADIYITFPYRHNVKYWSNTHFQEYDRDRFKTLIEMCGYKIVKEQHVILHRPWQFYLGFRPLMRLLFNKYHYNLYLLRLK